MSDWPSRWLCAGAAWVGMGVLAGCGSLPAPPASPIAPGDESALRQQLTGFIRHEMAQARVAGLSIALVDGQRVVWAEGFGWADASLRRPATPDTLYRAGSVSKLFTATAVMQLVEQGRVSLDDPVQTVLSGFRVAAGATEAPSGRSGPPDIRVRDLLTHQSGLPLDMSSEMWLRGQPPAGWGFRPMLAQRLPLEPMAAPPRLMTSYSNLGFDVAGWLVEVLSAQPFEKHLHSRVLVPAGMSSASFSTHAPEGPLAARGHMGGEVQEEPALRDVPAGGLNASVNDLAQFLQVQFRSGQPLLAPASHRQMLTRQNQGLPLDADVAVGLGWMLSTFGTDTVRGAGPVAHHGGATLFFRTQLMQLPQHGLGVVVMSNDAAAAEAVNRIAQRALALLWQMKGGSPQQPAEPGFRPAVSPWTAEQRQSWRVACSGEYITVAGPLTLGASPDGVLRAVLGGRRMELREGEGGRVGLGYRVLGLWPISLGTISLMGFECRQIDGRHVLQAVLDDQRGTIGQRLPGVAAGPAAGAAEAQAADMARWTPLQGLWRPRLIPGEEAAFQADGEVRFLIEQGRLWVELGMHRSFGGQRLRLLLVPEGSQQLRLVGPLADTGPVLRLHERPGQPPEVHFMGWVFDRVSPEAGR